MSYLPKYTITNPILKNVGAIDAAREVIDHAPLVPAWERRFQAEARAKIIHHGTHLEGNDLNLEEVEQILEPAADATTTPVLGRDRDIQEVINYRNVMDYIDALKNNLRDNKNISLTGAMLKEIHRQTVAAILPNEEAGKYRTVKVVIRNNTTGEITFRPPPPTEVPFYIDELFAWLNSSVGLMMHPLLRAGVLHYELARIHPFTDGNGRTARAMALLLLFLEGYQVKKFFALEEYYDSHPQEYYIALQSVATTQGDLTSWLEYFTLGIAIEFNRVKELVQKLSLDLRLKTTIGGHQITLTDRQIKLVEYIEKHATIGMGEARDILPDVSDDTVLRDLRDLVKKNLITKRGNTKGAKYYLKN
jgi:Fic family protein